MLRIKIESYYWSPITLRLFPVFHFSSERRKIFLSQFFPPISWILRLAISCPQISKVSSFAPRSSSYARHRVCRENRAKKFIDGVSHPVSRVCMHVLETCRECSSKNTLDIGRCRTFNAAGSIFTNTSQPSMLIRPASWWKPLFRFRNDGLFLDSSRQRFNDKDRAADSCGVVRSWNCRSFYF